jgi:hypothetical protein
VQVCASSRAPRIDDPNRPPMELPRRWDQAGFKTAWSISAIARTSESLRDAWDF